MCLKMYVSFYTFTSKVQTFGMIYLQNSNRVNLGTRTSYNYVDLLTEFVLINSKCQSLSS